MFLPQASFSELLRTVKLMDQNDTSHMVFRKGVKIMQSASKENLKDSVAEVTNKINS
jgi:hypothetical protein